MNFKVYDRPINTLQAMMDNSKVGDEITVYENGDQVVVANSLTNKYLNKDGSVKVRNKIMLWDETDHIEIVSGAQKVYEYLDDCMIFDTNLNCSKEQYDQVIEYLKSLGANILKLSSSAMCANIGDKIYDKKMNRVGTVVKMGQSGNYSLLYVDFGAKNPRKINPMDDAQIRQNYFKVLEE